MWGQVRVGPGACGARCVWGQVRVGRVWGGAGACMVGKCVGAGACGGQV